MSKVDFRSVLGQKVNEVEKPKPIPPGTYDAIIKNFELLEKLGKQENPAVRFTFHGFQPGADVDMDQLETAGGMEALSRRTMGFLFWLTPDAMWRLKEFLTEVCHLETDNRSFEEVLPETKNVGVKVVIEERIDARQELTSDINKVLPA